MKERNQYLVGDVIEKLKELPAESVQCAITSPPYWGLRDYGVAGQYGLEKTPEEHIAKMVEVFREVRRVLRNDGTFWLNYGDAYAGSGKTIYSQSNSSCADGKPCDGFRSSRYLNQKLPPRSGYRIKPKDLLMMPARLALALQADGWWLRSDIIWNKPNPMPEAVTDRPTKAHEYIFLLTKSARYFYDADAVREKYTEPLNRWGGDKTKPTDQSKGDEFAVKERVDREHRPDPLGRNCRSVWTIPTHPFPEAHFATFPPDLVKRCILAGTSHRACEVCGAPWERVVKSNIEGIGRNESGRYAKMDGNDGTCHYLSKTQIHGTRVSETLGFRPTCTCESKGEGRCIVLDPFMGSGTTAVVAQELGRDWVGIDLNPKYRDIAIKRLQGVTIGLGI